MKVVTDCLVVVGSILRSHPAMMAALGANPLAREFVVATLTQNPTPRLRRQMASLLTEARPMATLLLRWLGQELEGLKVGDSESSEFFDAVRDIVAANRGPAANLNSPEARVGTGAEEEAVVAEGAKPLDLRPLASVIWAKLMAMPRNGRGGASSQGVLQGCLAVLHDLVEIEGPDGDLLEGAELGKDLVDLVFSRFLFTMPEQQGKGVKVERPLCTEPVSRRAALSVLAAAARKSPHAMSSLLDNVDAFVGQVIPSLRGRWGYECSFDAKREQSGRFVGLKNQGCTCYMNSLLQQLFMIPPLQELLLGARLARQKLEEQQHQLVGRRVAVHWEAGGSLEAVVTAYNPSSEMHTVRYDTKEEAIFRLGPGGGRPGKETGMVNLVPGDGPASARGKGLTEKEATATVVEQVN
ncbi:unnamed protein product [Discosporangium mesarthrocarpum]